MSKTNPHIEITSLGAIEHVLQHHPHRILSLSLDPHAKRSQKATLLAKELGVRVDFNNQRKGVEAVARLAAFEYYPWEKFVKGVKNKPRSIVLILDHLQDSQNLGAICRSADGLGVDALFIPKDRGVQVNSGAYHASVGAVETIPLCRVTNLGNTIRDLKEMKYWILGASLGEKTTPPWEIPDFEKVALVLGAEYEGLSPSLAKLCDWHTEIPLSGKMPSLNVSVSAAILIYELSRRVAKK